MDGAACDDLHPLPSEDARRLIVRRVKPTPASQLGSYHGFITDRRDWNWRPIRPIENAIRDLKYGVGLNHMPSGRFTAPGWRYR